MSLGASLAAVAAAGLMVVHPPVSSERRVSDEPRVPPRLTSGGLREPNGLSWRSLKRAFNSGWRPTVKVKPERRSLYLSSHARQRAAFRAALSMATASPLKDNQS
jgi:hypothetical protein